MTIFFSNGLVLVAMSFVIIHHFFGFVHRVDQEDFYFSLPAGRLTLFTRLNLGALAYLTGPSLAVMGLNTLLAESLSPVLPEWDFYVLSTADLWSGYAGLLIRILYLFFLLEFCYLVTDKPTVAVGLFALFNLFWPLMLFFFSDATGRFLPGFPSPFIFLFNQPSSWLVFLFQLLSPLSFAGGLPGHHLMLAVMTLGLALITLFSFRFKKAGRPAAGLWGRPFRLAGWMGVLTLTLLAGYGAHYLRVLTGDYELTPADISPLPFLLGSGLGLVLGLWVLDLTGRKSGARWKSLLLTGLMAALPYAVWLAIMMTGAGGYSARRPLAGDLRRVGIYYEDSAAFSFASGARRGHLLELTDSYDLALFTRLYEAALAPGNPGLALPRTLSSREQAADFVRQGNPLEYFGDHEAVFYPFLSESRLLLETNDGQTLERSVTLPLYAGQADYLQLVRQNRRFFLMELSQYSMMDKGATSYRLHVTPHATPEIRAAWLDPLLAATKDDGFREPFLQYLTIHLAGHLAGQADGVLEELVDQSPCLIEVTFEPFAHDANLGGTATIELPLDPERIPLLGALLEELQSIQAPPVERAPGVKED